MSQSGSQYASDDISSDPSIEPQSRANSQRPSNTPGASRKRRRQSDSDSPDQIAARKYHLEGHYNDDYRALFNEDVAFASARFPEDTTFQPSEAQIGASKWSAKEKSVFFAALEKLGQNDTRGIAQALGTKSIPEVQEFLTLLTTVSDSRHDTRITPRDIPAATELSDECTQRLDLAGDTLAWYQERFEAKQEQDRFGEYWLVTPEIAGQMEDAIHPPGQSLDSSPPLDPEEEHKRFEASLHLLQEIPEAELIDVSMLLELSSSIFMNSAPKVQSSFPHWSTLVSPLASKPSMYRTALIDFHTLVISVTRRLTQASIIQATSRLRSQGWRSKNGVKPLLKRRDVLSAIDALKFRRNGKEWWQGLARRCKLSVIQGTEKRSRVLDWNEVEALMDIAERPSESMSMDPETPGATSGDESIGFKNRAARSGTPLPSSYVVDADDADDNEDNSEDGEDDESDRYYETESPDEELTDVDEAQDSQAQTMQVSSGRTKHTLGYELSTIEEFDAEASRQEELRLWAILGSSPSLKPAVLNESEHELDTPGVQNSLAELRIGADAWRSLIEYRAEWEEFQVPVPPQDFFATGRAPSPSLALRSFERHDVDPSRNATTEHEESRRKRRKTSEADIPMLGTGAYAAKALEAGQMSDENRSIDADMVDGFVAKSVEVADENFWDNSQPDDEMG